MTYPNCPHFLAKVVDFRLKYRILKGSTKNRRKKFSLNWTRLVSAQTFHPQPSLAKAEKPGDEVQLNLI
jgi:hypothetical protein